MFTDGCVVQTPSAPRVHSPLGSVVLSAELAVGFVQTVGLPIAPHSVCMHLSISIPVQTLAANMQCECKLSSHHRCIPFWNDLTVPPYIVPLEGNYS